jgi:hypothetical protein
MLHLGFLVPDVPTYPLFLQLYDVLMFPTPAPEPLSAVEKSSLHVVNNSGISPTKETFTSR